ALNSSSGGGRSAGESMQAKEDGGLAARDCAEGKNGYEPGSRKNLAASASPGHTDERRRQREACQASDAAIRAPAPLRDPGAAPSTPPDSWAAHRAGSEPSRQAPPGRASAAPASSPCRRRRRSARPG